jgi:hypothetical protein
MTNTAMVALIVLFAFWCTHIPLSFFPASSVRELKVLSYTDNRDAQHLNDFRENNSAAHKSVGEARLVAPRTGE